MSLGYKRDGEIAALYRYVRWIADASTANPSDISLQLFHRKCALITVNEIVKERQEMDKPNCNIISDRLADCAECDMAGNRPCSFPDHPRCKYRSSDYVLATVEHFFGAEALRYIEIYKSNDRRK